MRLLWFGTPIIIKHPEVGRHLQCLHCGNLGHPAARCQFTDAQLRGPGGIEVKEEEPQSVEDLAKPFSGPGEMRQMASRRLELTVYGSGSLGSGDSSRVGRTAQKATGACVSAD